MVGLVIQKFKNGFSSFWRRKKITPQVYARGLQLGRFFTFGKIFGFPKFFDNLIIFCIFFNWVVNSTN